MHRKKRIDEILGKKSQELAAMPCSPRVDIPRQVETVVIRETYLTYDATIEA